jgi:predicted permease
MREYNLEILTFIMFGMVTFSAVFYNGLSLVQDDVSLYVSFHPP